jgi:monoamine oxidase
MNTTEPIKGGKGDFVTCKTLIIGAGFAGLTAAANFFRNGYDDFLVLEAHDRIGGRCFTIDHDQGFLEYGAEFSETQMSHPLFDMIKKGEWEDQVDEIVKNEAELKDKSWQESAPSGKEAELVDFSGIDLNITKEEFENEDKCRQCFKTQDGEPISLKVAHPLFQLINQAIHKAIRERGSSKCRSNECNIGEDLYKSYLSLVQEKFKIDFSKISDSESDQTFECSGVQMPVLKFKKIVDGIFLWRWKWENIEKGCINLSDVFARHFGSKAETKPKPDDEQNKYSYKDILDALIEKHRTKLDERLRLSNSVKKIVLCEKWAPEQQGAKSMSECLHCQLTDQHEKVIVVAEDLVKKKEYYILCDNVICTMSLGFLKEHLDDLFVPARFVSQEKRQSIERLGYATYNKIFFRYETPFWEDQFTGLHLIWLPEEETTGIMKKKRAHLEHMTPSECDWVQDISSFKLAKSQKNVLYATLANSECFEKLDDQVIMAECTKLLRRFWGREDIPEPVSIMRYKWQSDPYIRGAYSYLSLDSSPTDIEMIAEPIQPGDVPLVLFSGEATDVESFSTVLGAFLAGIRESNRVLKAAKSAIPAQAQQREE